MVIKDKLKKGWKNNFRLYKERVIKSTYVFKNETLSKVETPDLWKMKVAHGNSTHIGANFWIEEWRSPNGSTCEVLLKNNQ